MNTILLDVILGVLSVSALVGLRLLQKSKKVKFPAMLMIALVFALFVGGIFLVLKGSLEKEKLQVLFTYQGLKFLAALFSSLMQMMIVPLVFFSILNVVVNQKFNSKKTIIRTLIGFVSVVLVGALIGFAFANIVGLGNNLTLLDSGQQLEKYTTSVGGYTFFGLLTSFVPNNIITSMLGRSGGITSDGSAVSIIGAGNVVGIMIFAALLGSSINRTVKRYEKQSKTLKDIIEAIFAALTYMTRTILIILPLSIFALISLVVIGDDFSSLSTLLIYAVVVFLSMVVLFGLELLAITLTGLSPAKYLKNVFPALVVAFSTSSSNATLPVTMNTLKSRSGVSVANGTLIPTLATNMGMGACAGIFPVVLAVLTMHSLNIEITFGTFVLTIFLAIMSSFGTQGIPGTATIAATFVLIGLNLPLGAIILVAPIDFFIDMFRTMVNVNGGMTVATIIDKSEGLLDIDLYNAEKTE